MFRHKLHILAGIFIVTFFVALISCEKEKTYPDGRFVGTWVSVDKKDTLIFISDDIMMRPATDGIQHTYIYNYTNDSITLQYKGPYLILVEPSTHYYFLGGDNLEIDFTNGGYGFNRDVIDFKRE
jgi:hypothetical protein